MLFFSALLLYLAPSSKAFSVDPTLGAVTTRSKIILNSDFGSAMPTNVSPYERIGINDDDLAIDIDPQDVITYLGTRDDLVEKAMADIPSLSRAQAEEEVGKFLLDSDAMKVFINFQKRKAEDPDFKVPGGEEDEGLFSVRNVVIAYLAFLASSNSEAIKEFARSKDFSSGIPFVDSWLNSVSDAASGIDASSVAVSSTDLLN